MISLDMNRSIINKLIHMRHNVINIYPCTTQLDSVLTLFNVPIVEIINKND